MMKRLSALLASAWLVASLADPAAAQRRDHGFDRPAPPPAGGAPFGGEWEPLGCVEVSRRSGVDSIEVGRREGRYAAIRFTAGYRDIFLDGARVIYGNGEPDNLNISTTLRDRETTRPIDLAGRERFISRIDVATQKAERDPGRGQLCAFGLKIEHRMDIRDDRRDDRRDDWRTDAVRGFGPGWEELGCVEVSRRPGIDSIEVGRREGRYAAVRFLGKYRDMYLDGARVIYGNGQPDDLKLRAQLRDGQATVPSDLLGRERFIRRIEVVTQKAERDPGHGQLCAYGLKVDQRRADPRDDRRPAPPPATWVDLGCTRISLGKDHDRIAVGRREGRFKAIRLLVNENSVKVHEIKVNYANGEPDVLAVGGTIRNGEISAPLDLKGRERAIQSVDVVMRTRIRGLISLLKGRAKVCVQGLQ